MTIERVAPGTEVYNRLEDVHYVTTEDKAYVITGTAGEQWPVDAKKVGKAYELAGGISAGQMVIGRPVKATATPGAETVFLARANGQVEIATAWGDVLTANRPGIEHGDGDYVVYASKDGKPDPDDRYVLNGRIGDFTYEFED